jgi:hypothetical protein
MAHCNYAMTIATCHHVYRWFHASWAHLRFGHRLKCSLAGLSWRARVGLATGPPLNFKVPRFSGDTGLRECLFPYPLEPSQRRNSQVSSIATPSKRCVHEFALNHTSRAACLLSWQEEVAGLAWPWQHLRHQPLIAMGFRFRRSARFDPLLTRPPLPLQML